MKKFNWQSGMKWLDSRHVRERAVLLCAGLAVIGIVWMALVHDVLTAEKATARRGIATIEARILDEKNRQADITRTYTTDPNNFALSRQRELRAAAQNADERLNQLYGELISPQQMSQMLTTILQNETSLNLVSLSNRQSEPLLDAAGAAAVASAAPSIQVFKHGMRMVFDGTFLETVSYLRSLERLEGNFFWENLEFELLDHPKARISLDIYTLSTEQGWIGV